MSMGRSLTAFLYEPCTFGFPARRGRPSLLFGSCETRACEPFIGILRAFFSTQTANREAEKCARIARPVEHDQSLRVLTGVGIMHSLRDKGILLFQEIGPPFSRRPSSFWPSGVRPLRAWLGRGRLCPPSPNLP